MPKPDGGGRVSSLSEVERMPGHLGPGVVSGRLVMRTGTTQGGAPALCSLGNASQKGTWLQPCRFSARWCSEKGTSRDNFWDSLSYPGAWSFPLADWQSPLTSPVLESLG